MKPPQQHSRIDIAELKAQLVKKLGPDGSKQYFSYLHRFLSLKLSKVEFNKLCLRILGRENITLHNQFIRSVLKNASTAKLPPPIHHKDEELYHDNTSHNNTTQPSWSVALSNGKAKYSHQLTENKSSGSNAVLENGNIDLPDVDRLAQLHHEIARSPHKNNEHLVSHPSKMLELRRLPDGSAPVNDKGQTELRDRYCSKQDCGPSQVSVGGAQMPSSSGVDFFSHGALLDSATLRERMERIALIHGLEKGVSLDCANLLNLGLDSYLKGLIGSSIELRGTSRSGQKLQEIDGHKHYPDTKLVNGVRPGYQLQTQGNRLVPISLQEFKVAMETNPRQLGQHWPLLLEKISTRAFEE